MKRLALSFFGLLVLPTGAVAGADLVSMPPVERVVCAAKTDICAKVTRPEKLQPGSMPTLSIGPRNSLDDVAARPLSYVVGPRFIRLTDTGYVVTFDEWIRKKDTPYAIQIFSKSGDLIKTFSLREVLAKSDQSEQSIKENAKFGPWLAEEPVVQPGGRSIEFSVGLARLTLDLSDSVPELTACVR